MLAKNVVAYVCASRSNPMTPVGIRRLAMPKLSQSREQSHHHENIVQGFHLTL